MSSSVLSAVRRAATHAPLVRPCLRRVASRAAPPPPHSAPNPQSRRRPLLVVVAAAAAASAGVAVHSHSRADAVAASSAQVPTQPLPVSATASKPAQPAPTPAPPPPQPQQLINWSGTHSVATERFFQPESLAELKAIVHAAHDARRKVRPVGSALSPNGIPLCEAGMLNAAAMDKVLSVDVAAKRVTVQAGARVCEVVDALRPHGLTLANFASITEQQMGGFTQVGAHGTGAFIPPVDEQVVAVRLVTPAAGEVFLSADDPHTKPLLQLARTSLGMLGVVAELTLQCVDAHRLVERTAVMTRSQAVQGHAERLHDNRHVRYMWLPHVDCVVVVTCNASDGVDVELAREAARLGDLHSIEEHLAPARKLLLEHPRCAHDAVAVCDMPFVTLRDELLALDPISVDWVRKVSEVEAHFWRCSEGVRIDWSDRILQFNCGGQQWVSEVCFPVPVSAGEGSHNDAPVDMRYMLKLLEHIERDGVPAHCPLEQRWTARSESPMSPASGGAPGTAGDAELFSWVGIIMYLPSAETRSAVTKAFAEYKGMCDAKLWNDFGAVEHWAKIEMPATDDERARLQGRTARKYPVDAFRAVCDLFDPHGILRNDLTDAIFGFPSSGA